MGMGGRQGPKGMGLGSWSPGMKGEERFTRHPAGVCGTCATSRLSALNTQEAGPGLLDVAQGWPPVPSALSAKSPKLEGQAKWVTAFHSDRCPHTWAHPGSLSQCSEKHGTWDCRLLVPKDGS